MKLNHILNRIHQSRWYFKQSVYFSNKKQIGMAQRKLWTILVSLIDSNNLIKTLSQINKHFWEN